MGIRIQEGPFDPGGELNAFAELSEGAGAVATFTGLVRAGPDDPIATLTLECYPELAVHQIGAIVTAAHERFGLLDATVIHRYGVLKPGEPIVMVMTLAPRREAAFQAAEFLMDYLKTEAPFWKKETGPQGSRWVEHRTADERARARWE